MRLYKPKIHLARLHLFPISLTIALSYRQASSQFLIVVLHLHNVNYLVEKSDAYVCMCV